MPRLRVVLLPSGRPFRDRAICSTVTTPVGLAMRTHKGKAKSVSLNATSEIQGLLKRKPILKTQSHRAGKWQLLKTAAVLSWVTVRRDRSPGEVSSSAALEGPLRLQLHGSVAWAARTATLLKTATSQQNTSWAMRQPYHETLQSPPKMHAKNGTLLRGDIWWPQIYWSGRKCPTP